MRHNRVRGAKLFYLDRTPFVAASATLFAIFVFVLMLTNGMPRFGPSDLPRVNHPVWADDAYDDNAIVIVVVDNGRVFWGQDPISMDDLRHELRRRLERNPKSRIFLAVDARASWRNVAPVLGALRLVGVESIVFLVDQSNPRLSVIYSQPDVWNVGRLWSTLDSLSRVDLLLPAFMLANTGVILCVGLYRYKSARSQSRTFMRDATQALRNCEFHEVIAIAARNSRSRLASVFAESFAAYTSAPSDLTDTEAIAAAQRACQRSSKSLTAHSQGGLNTISNIAASAPLIGFLGTINGILGCFTGTTGPASAALARLASGLAAALSMSAVGLLVSLLAVWSFNYLRGRFEVLENEMLAAGLEAVTYLRAHPDRREQFQQTFATSKVFNVGNGARAWEIPYDRQRPLLLAVWCCALYFGYALVLSWLLR